MSQVVGKSYLERVLLGEERGVVSWVIRGIAWPFSLLYQAGLVVFLALYKLGLRKRHRLPVPVVSIGNLTFGGTGKTPTVEAVCRILVEQGRKAVVLSRGHGGSAKGPLVVSDGESLFAGVFECGDEPVALARVLNGTPIIVGKDRRASGELACARFQPDVVVLDDGFQYWQLERELDIVVMDASRPFGSGFVMPMGDLREPVGGLTRADVVLLNGARSLNGSARNALRDKIAHLAPNALVLDCDKQPRALTGPAGERISLDWLKGRRIVAFCGIGRPDSFFNMLSSLGADVCDRLTFADHHEYTRADLALINSRCETLGAEAVVTTEKDHVRIDTGAIRELYVLNIELEIDEEKRLAELLASVFNKTRETTTIPKEAD